MREQTFYKGYLKKIIIKSSIGLEDSDYIVIDSVLEFRLIEIPPMFMSGSIPGAYRVVYDDEGKMNSYTLKGNDSEFRFPGRVIKGLLHNLAKEELRFKLNAQFYSKDLETLARIFKGSPNNLIELARDSEEIDLYTK